VDHPLNAWVWLLIATYIIPFVVTAGNLVRVANLRLFPTVSLMVENFSMTGVFSSYLAR
jgi:hypothetical protein